MYMYMYMYIHCNILCISITGIEIHDKLRFFTGDHPATDFEKGTQQGGTYPCGGCGIHVDMIDDSPHALRLPTRSLLQLQTIATAGKFGKNVVTYVHA